MSLSRKDVLDEMGLSPQWVRRDHPPVVRQASALPKKKVAHTAHVEHEESAGLIPSVKPASERTAHTLSTQIVEQMDWEDLRQIIGDCHACGLCKERKQAVPGVGDETADWLFIGEGPGAEEDARGEPFVGQAGKLLDAMLAAIDLKRGADVYIANAVKCRPPGNRTPEAAEMAACAPYLKRQIRLLQPRLMVLLGKAAVHAVLGEESSLASLRGKSLFYHDGEVEIPVVVTYHPAYLLRNLPDKSKAWEDLCRARSLMSAAKAG